jgi:hypothetical protein
MDALMPPPAVLTRSGCVSQKLNLRLNSLVSLPHELSSLQNLKELQMSCNEFLTLPVSALSGMTALNMLQCTSSAAAFQVTSSLLPILHPGQVELDLSQGPRHSWDSVSLFHLGRAMLEVAERRPVPTLLFED